ncbi:alpha/beta fold hydrolase [Streptoverticillium reticulum]|uniref:alpha/beta fold hydrolase n=1 Tax=Streptoverticillium reticulum TaxID=1433415 RepID=UPI0039BFAF3B
MRTWASRRTGFLAVGGGHTLRWWQSGNPRGKALLILHGGPGGRSSARQRTLADPGQWRIIQVDQRGCGSSTPRGHCAANTLDDLVEDLERLRRHLGIDRWTVLGPSWGAVLALASAARRPHTVRALLLTGLFLGTARECEVFRTGRGVDPSAWRGFTAWLDPAEREDVPGAYARRIHNPAHPDHETALRHWCAFDLVRSSLEFDPLRVPVGPGVAESLRVETHYVRNNFFLPSGGVLAMLPRTLLTPVTVVQGVQDRFGAENALLLRESALNTSVTWIDGGHSALEPALRIGLSIALEEINADRHPKEGKWM